MERFAGEHSSVDPHLSQALRGFIKHCCPSIIVMMEFNMQIKRRWKGSTRWTNHRHGRLCCLFSLLPTKRSRHSKWHILRVKHDEKLRAPVLTALSQHSFQLDKTFKLSVFCQSHNEKICSDGNSNSAQKFSTKGSRVTCRVVVSFYILLWIDFPVCLLLDSGETGFLVFWMLKVRILWIFLPDLWKFSRKSFLLCLPFALCT